MESENTTKERDVEKTRQCCERMLSAKAVSDTVIIDRLEPKPPPPHQPWYPEQKWISEGIRYEDVR